MKQNVKDITARYGGEFVIALPNIRKKREETFVSEA